MLGEARSSDVPTGLLKYISVQHVGAPDVLRYAGGRILLLSCCMCCKPFCISPLVFFKPPSRGQYWLWLKISLPHPWLKDLSSLCIPQRFPPLSNHRKLHSSTYHVPFHYEYVDPALRHPFLHHLQLCSASFCYITPTEKNYIKHIEGARSPLDENYIYSL